MRKIIVLAVLLSISSLLQAQVNRGSSYTNALGVKVWDGGGVTFKHFFNTNNAGELIGYFWTQGVRITGLYEFHFPIPGAEGLRWYVGPGVHIGFYNTKFGNGSFAGIDGVIGLDYKFNAIPLNISLDWQPSFEFGDNRGFYGSWGGLGVRYTFN